MKITLNLVNYQVKNIKITDSKQSAGNLYNQKINFTSKVKLVLPEDKLTEEQKGFIDKFEEANDFDRQNTLNCRYLGEGVASRVYFSPAYNLVIKQNKENKYIPRKSISTKGSLWCENDILNSISERVKTTQRGIACVRTEKFGEFLLSTFVPGKPADYKTNPFQPKHIDRLLRNLYRLDREEIMHSDLTRPNLLLDDNYNVNIIDYQWAQKFITRGSNTFLKNVSFPEFEAPNNALSFESAGLSGYLRDIAEDSPALAKQFFRDYLIRKAYYVEKNVKRLEELYQLYKSDEILYVRANADQYMLERIKFEKIKAAVYRNPTDKVIEAELLKMDILNLNRKQYTCHDVNKIEPRNILMGIPYCVKMKQYADELSGIKESPTSSAEERQYINYMRQYGYHWQKNIEDWHKGLPASIFKWVWGILPDPAHIIFPEMLNKFKKVKDLSILRPPQQFSLYRLTPNEKSEIIIKELLDLIMNFNKKESWQIRDSIIRDRSADIFEARYAPD